MKLLLLFALLIVPILAAAQAKTENKLWFVYLVKGPTPRPAEEAEVLKMQQAHIGNFQRRFAEGKLIAAGPLNDPSTKRRGIVVLTVPTKEDVRKAFEGDTYVESGVMAIEAAEWKANPAAINKAAIDPSAIAEYRFVVLKAKKGGKLTVAQAKAHSAYAKSLGASIGGETVGAPRFTEVLLFDTTDDVALKARLAKDPLISSGWAEYEILPLWMAKGTIGKP